MNEGEGIKIFRIIGGHGALLLTTDSRVITWGGNRNGLIIGSNNDYQYDPIDITEYLINYLDSTIEDAYSTPIIKTSNGSYYVWGNNFRGQLGIEKTESTPTDYFSIDLE